LTAPVAAIALAVGLQAVDFLTPLHTEALRYDAVAEPLQVALLVAGCAYLWPAMAADPVPRRLGHATAVVHVLVLFPLSTLVGIAIESGTHSPDLGLAGGILWTVGGIGSIAATLGVLVRWLLVEERSSPGRAAGLDEGAHAQLVAWREARAAAAADEAARREAAAARRR
jgi:cytochrome c oxidase assembly factor CtaG